jgi:hypothetical protein
MFSPHWQTHNPDDQYFPAQPGFMLAIWRTGPPPLELLPIIAWLIPGSAR